jgi:2-methylcitrate dehydratase PrpD
MVQKRVANHFAIYEPEHMIQAQFSVPYAVSMVLMEEPPGPNWYADDLLKNSRALELQHKVKLEGDPVLTRKYYVENKYTSTVEIITRTKERFNKHIEYPKGDPENPFSQQDHINKLTNMASSLGMKQNQITEVVEALSRLEELDTISQLTRLLVAQ